MSLRAFLFLLAAAPSLVAQQPVTRAQAVAAALARGTRAAFGRADSAAAAGALHGARLYPNPLLSATYTKDVPHYHVIARSEEHTSELQSRLHLVCRLL